MVKKKIYVSPSSQTDNKYAVGGTTEAIQCRKIAAQLLEALKRCGFEAMTNTSGDMYKRVAESNQWGADLHLPIHTNAHNKKVMGTRLFSYDKKGEGYQACKAIMDALAPITPGTSDSITANKSLYEIKNTYAPTAYIEVAFHDNPEEAKWIMDNTQAIAEAVCKGVCKYYGADYTAPDAVLYCVQLGAFSNLEHAKDLQRQLAAAGFAGSFLREVPRE